MSHTTDRSSPTLGPLSWVLIYVEDLERMREFYEDALGLEVGEANAHFATYQTGPCTLELMARGDNGPSEPSAATGWDRNRMHVSFHVADLEGVVERLAQHGLRPRHGIRPTVPPPGASPTGRLAQFEDPEGNLVEICDESPDP